MTTHQERRVEGLGSWGYRDSVAVTGTDIAARVGAFLSSPGSHGLVGYHYDVVNGLEPIALTSMDDWLRLVERMQPVARAWLVGADRLVASASAVRANTNGGDWDVAAREAARASAEPFGLLKLGSGSSATEYDCYHLIGDESEIAEEFSLLDEEVTGWPGDVYLVSELEPKWTELIDDTGELHDAAERFGVDIWATMPRSDGTCFAQHPPIEQVDQSSPIRRTQED